MYGVVHTMACRTFAQHHPNPINLTVVHTLIPQGNSVFIMCFYLTEAHIMFITADFEAIKNPR